MGGSARGLGRGAAPAWRWPQGEARDFTWISTEARRRTGTPRKAWRALNRAPAEPPGPARATTSAWTRPSRIGTGGLDAVCKAAATDLSGGTRPATWPGSGARLHTVPMSKLDWYPGGPGACATSFPPGRLLRRPASWAPASETACTGGTGNSPRPYALPEWRDPARWEAVAQAGAGGLLWLLATKAYGTTGGNAGIALMMREVAQNVRGHAGGS